ncbi:hypothetical protein C3B58_16865 [Lactonifactor longoviformis]|nr:hypothetical protein C3B58_16865 [Lactonifactor longoviformis]
MFFTFLSPYVSLCLYYKEFDGYSQPNSLFGEGIVIIGNWQCNLDIGSGVFKTAGADGGGTVREILRRLAWAGGRPGSADTFVAKRV